MSERADIHRESEPGDPELKRKQLEGFSNHTANLDVPEAVEGIKSEPTPITEPESVLPLAVLGSDSCPLGNPIASVGLPVNPRPTEHL